MSTTRLHFIRHGEAYSNIPHVGKVVSGIRGDKGLTPRGVAQVERLRGRLLATGELAADVVLASTLPRAWQTAEILAPVWDSPIIPDDDLHELRPGESSRMSGRCCVIMIRRIFTISNNWLPVSAMGLL